MTYDRRQKTATKGQLPATAAATFSVTITRIFMGNPTDSAKQLMDLTHRTLQSGSIPSWNPGGEYNDTFHEVSQIFYVAFKKAFKVMNNSQANPDA